MSALDVHRLRQRSRRRRRLHELRIDAKWHPDLAAPGAALLTKRETANLLRVCPNTLRKMEGRGELPEPVVVAGRACYRRVDIDIMIGMRGPAPASEKERADRFIEQLRFGE